MDIIIGITGAFVVGFSCCFVAFRQGLKDGYNLKNEKQIEKIVKTKAQKVELTDEQKKIAEKLKYINEYEVK